MRKDVETFGRKARVVFGRDWKADAERRDFTINSLSATADGLVHDYVGGLADIAARRVRFIGEPQQRIEEDYLRILRFFRFHAHFGEGAPDAAGVHACIVARSGSIRFPASVCGWSLKLLVAARATSTLVVMAECGLLGVVLGGVGYLASFENMIKVEAASGAETDAIRRLGALGLWVAEDAERLTQRLRLSNAESERLSALDRWWRVAAKSDPQAGRALLYRLGPQSFTDRSLLAWARSEAGAADKNWHAYATLPQRWIAPIFPLKAADFMRRGVAAGPALGVALRAAEESWVAADFPMDGCDRGHRGSCGGVRTSARAMNATAGGRPAPVGSSADEPAPSPGAAANAPPASHCRATRSRRRCSALKKRTGRSRSRARQESG